MIERLIIISTIAAFLDLLFFKLQVWDFGAKNKTIAKVVECEFCRSFWTCLFISVIMFLFLKISGMQILLAAPSTIVKLIIDKKINSWE